MPDLCIMELKQEHDNLQTSQCKVWERAGTDNIWKYICSIYSNDFYGIVF